MFAVSTRAFVRLRCDVALKWRSIYSPRLHTRRDFARGDIACWIVKIGWATTFLKLKKFARMNPGGASVQQHSPEWL